MNSQTTTESIPLSLRPRPKKDANSESLNELVGRIYQERGQLSNVAEETLKQEIEDARDAAATTEQPCEGEDGKDKPQDFESRQKELFEAREEMIKFVA